MKLLTSLKREFTLLRRSLYFYVEIAMAALCLVLLLLVMPKQMDRRVTENFYFDLPREQAARAEADMVANATGVTVEDVAIKVGGGETVAARKYTSDEKYMIFVDSRADLIKLSDAGGDTGVAISLRDNQVFYDIYVQGYETAQFRRYASLISAGNISAIVEATRNQPVVALTENARVLNDRQALLPMLIAVNGVVMGILVMVGYVLEDKKTNTFTALRVAPAPLAAYLFSKAATVTVTSLVTTLIITLPVMGFKANYLLLALVVLSGCFFTVMLGAILASLYGDMVKAIAGVFILVLILMFPAAISMVPSWNPVWLRFIPSYYLVPAIRDALLQAAPGEALLICAGYAAAALLLFLLAVRCYRRPRAMR